MRAWLIILTVFSYAVSASELNVLTEEFPYFQYTDERGDLVGSAADKVRRVLNNAEIDYSINVDTWSVTYNAAQRNSNSCIFSIARAQSREKLFDWLFPLGQFSVSFYGLRDKKYSINSLEDAKQYKTAVIRQNFSHLYLKENGFVDEQHLLIISTFDNVFELLATRKGLLDLVILSDIQFEYKSKTEPLAKELEKLYTLPNFGSQLYFACNKELSTSTKNKIIRAHDALYK
ncbi:MULTISPECIES: transporter substrate-binding domain-containing protein [Pseudoalteromonas]|uniref:Amino acid ABC transporter substrate-binding protein n=1 Tax=Pseudoalteromonas amylolytica TaxID=1859457 RepID=A0A1S1MZ56_9GAMM|nr:MULTISPECIES: transporter substrate-binding domain-containing protein [Pseudoalteromonas]MCF6434300.1 transporter substrate-binding domain-containing protein [Pseudoalteromonas sp. MMG022]OHU85345.1 amino acid ABC transporter substrate-binding protein [Pseudoalteromonas sp. JW3]OHU93034.1 amino acid ABC transporter substrate-binding protein [Pseudoalteromonas amylolytica]